MTLPQPSRTIVVEPVRVATTATKPPLDEPPRRADAPSEPSAQPAARP